MIYYTILTHNGQHLVNALVRSIKETEPKADYDILIVDNGSKEPVTHKEASCTIHTGENYSYADASNLGVAEAARLGATHVVVLSDDVVMMTPHLTKAVDLLRFVDFVGPRTVHLDGRLQSSGHTLNPGMAHAINLTDDTNRGRMVMSVIGSCIFTTTEKWQAVGGFPRELQYYHEDVALGLNAWSKDMTVWYEPSITVTHHEGATRGNDLLSKMATPARQKNWEAEERSRVLFANRIRGGYWKLDAIRAKVAELNK